jgi:glycosyltransferase involved in cell wall biosynthesis
MSDTTGANAASVSFRVLFTITRYWPATGGAEIHTRELIHHLTGDIQPVIAAHWSTNRTDWLLGTTAFAPLKETSYLDRGQTVHLVAPTLGERLRNLPLIAGYYGCMPVAAPRLAQVLTGHLLAVAGPLKVVHNVRSGREVLTLASMGVARRQGIPFIFTPNHHPRWVGWRYRVFRDIYRQADALIALTEHERETLVELGARPERVHVTGIGPVLAPAADADRARQKYGLNGRFVLFVGQKYPYKGAGELLAAARIVWQRHPDVEFMFVGPRTPHSVHLFRSVEDRRAHEVGLIDLQDKTDLLAACSMVCLPSSQESFGGVLVEAWAMGKPVVAGPAPALAEVISDGADGFFTPEQSASAIAERLIRLLDDPSLAASMGQSGQRKVAERFTWARLAAETMRIYKSLQ